VVVVVFFKSYIISLTTLFIFLLQITSSLLQYLGGKGGGNKELGRGQLNQTSPSSALSSKIKEWANKELASFLKTSLNALKSH
jgi:hypothetical protein